MNNGIFRDLLALKYSAIIHDHGLWMTDGIPEYGGANPIRRVLYVLTTGKSCTYVIASTSHIRLPWYIKSYLRSSSNSCLLV